MIFYKLTKIQADLIGEFEYSKGKHFSPYVGDGINFYIAEVMYDLLKDTEQFKKLNFTKLPTVDKIDFKPIKL